MADQIRQHKRMAMGESIGDNFGVTTFQEMVGRKPDGRRTAHKNVVGDDKRGPPVDMGDGAHAQANPDHGY